MTTLAETLEARWRRELAEWRRQLVLELDAPVTQAAAPNHPAIYRGANGEWEPARIMRVRVRPATYGETLDMLEQHTAQPVQHEAATIEGLVRLFIPGDEATQNIVIARLGERWQWTPFDHTDASDAPPVLLARAEIKTRVATLKEPQRPRSCQVMEWPEWIDRAEAVEWLAEVLERLEPGQGSRYRDWCMGVADVRVYQGIEGQRLTFSWPGSTAIDPDVPFIAIESSKSFLGDRTGMPFSLPLDVPTPDGIVQRLATGEQLAWLYWAASPARSVRSYLGRIASVDAQKRLVTLTAPSALKKEKAESSEAAAGDLAEQVRQSVAKLNAAMPPDASSEAETAKAMDRALADHLETIGPHGKALAKIVRSKSAARAPGEHWYLWRHEADGERFLVLLARALWVDQVRPELERKRERATAPVRFSTPLANTFAAARLRPVEGDADIIVEAPRGLTLILPFGEALTQSPGSRGLVNLRRVLDGAALRTYLATLAIYGDSAGGLRTDGLFAIEGDQILDIIGALKQSNTKRGVTTQIYQSRDRKVVEQHLRQFAAIRVRAIGDTEAVAGDALVDSIHERSTRKLRYHAHSRLIVQHMLKDYMRVPKAVCALAAGDVPLALSLTGTVRQRVFQNLKDGKPIEAPIAELAAGAGLDLLPQVRKHGPRYLDELAEDFSRVADAGEIASVRRLGAGRDAVLVITPRDALLDSYKPLLASAVVHAKAKRAALTADKRGPRRGK